MTAEEYKLLRGLKCFMMAFGFPEVGIVEAKAFLRKHGK